MSEKARINPKLLRREYVLIPITRTDGCAQENLRVYTTARKREATLRRRSENLQVDGQVLLGIFPNGFDQFPALHKHLVGVVVESGILQ